MAAPQDDNTRKKPAPKAQPRIVAADDSIPDSLLHARWRVKRTVPVTTEDLDSMSLDLKTPDNLKPQVVYNDTLGGYVLGTKMGDTYLNAPVLMSPEEYMRWTEHR